MTSAMCFVLVAGEVSGDRLGAGLIESLRRTYPQAQFVGIGGPAMAKVGFQAWFDIRELAVMGLLEVLRHLPRLWRLKRHVIERTMQVKPVAYIGIDAPDFNLRIAHVLKQRGLKTVHYVSPSIWAWRPQRVHKIAQALDLMLSILPFEPPLYQQQDLTCTFVGHPLADSIPLQCQREVARAALQLNSTPYYIACLPGSRASEVRFLAPVFLQALAQLSLQIPHLVVLAPFVHAQQQTQFLQLHRKLAPQLKLQTYLGHSLDVMQASDQVLLASGTATLEAMLCHKPMVVAYKVNPVSYQIAKRMMLIDKFSLPNLLSEGKIEVPELIQHACTVENMVAHLLEQKNKNLKVFNAACTSIHQQLRKNANQVAAEAITDLIGV
jgi:lipid-A-disaccharide synthase